MRVRNRALLFEELRALGLPGVAVRHERLLERRGVDADEAHVGDALLVRVRVRVRDGVRVRVRVRVGVRV